MSEGDFNPALVFLVFFPVVWCLSCMGVAWAAGWRHLAESYRHEGPFEGRKWRFRSAQFRFASYSNVLTYGANADGLYLAVFLPFRPGHPPLLIPWKDVRKTTRRWYEFFGTPLLLGAQNPVRVTTYWDIVRDIENEVARKIPATPDA